MQEAMSLLYQLIYKQTIYENISNLLFHDSSEINYQIFFYFIRSNIFLLRVIFTFFVVTFEIKLVHCSNLIVLPFYLTFPVSKKQFQLHHDRSYLQSWILSSNVLSEVPVIEYATSHLAWKCLNDDTRTHSHTHAHTHFSEEKMQHGEL